jgi:nitrogenase molybdenum-iron protein alpha/beta subunit
MLCYVRPNIIIKALQEIYKTPLYVSINVAIKPNCQSLTELTNANEMILKMIIFDELLISII